MIRSFGGGQTGRRLIFGRGRERSAKMTAALFCNGAARALIKAARLHLFRRNWIRRARLRSRDMHARAGARLAALFTSLLAA